MVFFLHRYLPIEIIAYTRDSEKWMEKINLDELLRITEQV